MVLSLKMCQTGSVGHPGNRLLWSGFLALHFSMPLTLHLPTINSEIFSPQFVLDIFFNAQVRQRLVH